MPATKTTKKQPATTKAKTSTITKVDAAALEKAFLGAFRGKVKKATVVQQDGGRYRAIKLDGRTLAYVHATGRGLRVELIGLAASPEAASELADVAARVASLK